MSYIRRGRQSSFYLPKIIPILGTVVFFLTLVANTWALSAQAVAPGVSDSQATQTATNVASTETTESTAAAAKTTTTQTISSGTISAAITPATPDIATCSTDRAYRAPAIVDLSVAHDGLTAIVSDPYTYTVSARTLSGLRSGIAACPIRVTVAGNYHAITARQVSWSYAFSQSGAQCTIKNVRVGLHVTQLLPAFAPKADTAQSVIDAWNTYHANLVTHENGHVNVAKQYANDLVNKLNALGTNDCGTIKAQAQTTVSSVLSALNATDTDYDATTGHGATQGAVL